VQGVIGFGFASHWRKILKTITKRSNLVITFNSQKTALSSPYHLLFQEWDEMMEYLLERNGF